MKNDSTFSALGCLVLTATALLVGAHPIESGQSEPEERILQDTADHIELSESRIRCGKYFVLESRNFGGFDVKQVHIVLPMSSTNVALVSLYYNDIQTVIDESKDRPVLLRTKDETGRHNDVVRLSRTALDEAEECLPPPDEN